MLPYFYPAIGFLCILTIIFFCDTIIDYLLLRSFVGPRYRLFVAPGVIIHELSHAAFAVLTGCKVTNINVTAPDGGFIIHSKPRHPILQVIISLAPIFGITFFFYLFTRLLEPQLLTPITNYSPSSLVSLLNFSFSWHSLLYIYLTLSFAAALAPSKQDIKIALPGLLIIFLFLIIIAFTPLYPFILNFFRSLWQPFFILLTFLAISIILSFIFFLVTPAPQKKSLRYSHRK